MRNRTKILLLLLVVPVLILTGCTSPFSGECWDIGEDPDQTDLQVQNMVGLYTSNLSLYEEGIDPVDPSPADLNELRLESDMTMSIRRISIDWGEGLTVYKDVAGTWETAAENGMFLVNLDLDGTSYSTYFIIRKVDGVLHLYYISGDPDSCEGYVFVKAE